MKKYLVIAVVALLAACGNEENKKETAEAALEVATEVSTIEVDSVCFIRTDGTKHQDTAAVKLYIKGNSVTGKMMYLPYEKDWRLGNISGKKQGSKIETRWTFMQEGMVDSLAVQFDIDGDKLVEYNGGTTYEYTKADCSKFPAYDFDFGK